MPQEWTKSRSRCRAAGVPEDAKFQTRHEQALEMLDESGLFFAARLDRM